jgi:phosphatidylinositol alpha-1,6-mannosyltransferase
MAGGGEGLPDRLRLLWRLVRPDRCALHHFIFTPHRAASRAVKAVLTVSKKPSVHTIPSQPRLDGEHLDTLLFADRTVAVSEATAIWLRTAGACDVRVIRPGVEVPPEAADRTACRARLRHVVPGLELGDAPCLLYPGDLEVSDGADVFVRAALRLAEARPEARFVLACRPKTPASQAVRARLERLVASHGLGRRIRFLGVVREMATLLGAVDLVVMPVSTLFAKVDFPLVVLEAMALGTPAMVSDLPSLRELAGLGRGVVVVRHSDPDAVATAALPILGSAEQRNELGAHARRSVATHFPADRMAQAYETLYRELI